MGIQLSLPGAQHPHQGHGLRAASPKRGKTKEIQHLSRAPRAAPGAVSHPEQSCEQMARGDRPWRGSRCPLQHARCSGARGGQALPYFHQLWQRSRAFCFTSSHFEAVSIPPVVQTRGLHPETATGRDGQPSPASEGCSSRIPRYLRVPKKQHRENKVPKIALLEQFSPAPAACCSLTAGEHRGREENCKMQPFIFGGGVFPGGKLVLLALPGHAAWCWPSRRASSGAAGTAQSCLAEELHKHPTPHPS